MSKSGIFAALDAAPMTPSRYVIWALASGGTFIDGFSVAALGVALPLIRLDFTVSSLLVGLTGAALVLGAVLGASFGGIAADRFGRKPVFLVDMAILAAGAFLCATAPDPWLIVLGQFVIGIGVGVDFPTSGSYVSEIVPQHVRNRMIVATIALQSVGMVVAALVSLAILGGVPASSDWRLLLAASGVLAVVVLLGRMRLPESPRWLAERGRMDAALAVLQRLGDPASAGIAPEPAHARPAPQPQAGLSQWSSLFAPQYRARTLLVSLPWMLMDVATYGVGLFTPVILGAMHVGESIGTGPIAREFADAAGSAAVDVFLLVGFFLGILAVPKFGRIRMQVLGFAGMAVGMTLLVVATLGSYGSTTHLGLVIGGFVLFNLAMNAGPNATTFTLAPMLFPTGIRGSAAGFAAACAKIGATCGTFVVPLLQEAWGLASVLILMVVVSLAGLIATAAFSHVVNEENKLEETPQSA